MFRYDGNKAAFATKIGMGALSVGLGVLEGYAQYKKANGFTAEFFAWAAKSTALMAISIPVVGAAVSGFMAVSGPLWGPIGVVGLAAGGIYLGIRTVAQSFVEAWKEEPDSWQFQAGSFVLEKMKAFEASISGAVEKAVTFLFEATLDFIGIEDFRMVGGEMADFTYDEENVLLYGYDNAHLFGGDKDDWLVHSGYGAAYGGKGDDLLLGLFPKVLRKGEKIGDPPPEEALNLRPEAGSDLSLFLDGGEGDDWIITVLGEGAITIGGAGRDWIFNTSKYGHIYGDTFSGLDGFVAQMN